MAKHDTYVLHVWRSRAVGGWQWVARVEHAADGQRHRFADPEALLAHLRVVVGHPRDGTEAGEGRPETGSEEPEMAGDQVRKKE